MANDFAVDAFVWNIFSGFFVLVWRHATSFCVLINFQSFIASNWQSYLEIYENLLSHNCWRMINESVVFFRKILSDHPLVSSENDFKFKASHYDVTVIFFFK